MATIKHISSKNADYGAAEKYLTFQHDEFTNKPILDEQGHLIPREDYRIATLNCGDEDFAFACMRANLRYQKNLRRDDVKSHHYIISFDPRDEHDHGLTLDQAQAMGEKFCRENFPGHQAIVCTHPDGHNHTGNIHVHIVINSLRITDVERKPYMDRPCDTQAGAKHRCTASALRYFRANVMEMCQEAGLYQIDLLNGRENRVTEREYWAAKRGQAKLDQQSVQEQESNQENAAPDKKGNGKPRKFETDKEKLRQEIRAVLAVAASFEDFSERLLQRGITVKESRGRLSYLTPDRTKPITARRLGDAFDSAAVCAALDQNALLMRNAQEKQKSVSPHQKAAVDQPRGTEKQGQASVVQRLVDIAAKYEEGKGRGYIHWAQSHNLQQTVATLNFLTENDLLDPKKLDDAITAKTADVQKAMAAIKPIEQAIEEKKELLQNVQTYHRTKYVQRELKALKSDKARAAYRQKHESDFILFEVSTKYFKAHGVTKIPSMKTLQAEIDQLFAEKAALYSRYQEQKQQLAELRTVRKNVDQVLYGAPRTRKKEQER